METKKEKKPTPRKAGYIKDSGFKITESGETEKKKVHRVSDPRKTLSKYYAKDGEEKTEKKRSPKSGGESANRKRTYEKTDSEAVVKHLPKKEGTAGKKTYRKHSPETEQPAEVRKITLEKPTTALCPVPAVIVSCGKTGEDANMLTIAWTGTVNSVPPMLSVSVQKKRFSHHLIKRDMEFVVNIPTQEMVKKLDWVGVKSGKDVNKWEKAEFTQLPAEEVVSPLIRECPINLECRVTQVIELPTHDMFLAEIVKVHADENLMDGKGQFHPEWAHLVTFSHGKYFGVPRTCLMKIGESVMKPKTEKRIENERKGKRREARRK